MIKRDWVFRVWLDLEVRFSSIMLIALRQEMKLIFTTHFTTWKTKLWDYRTFKMHAPKPLGQKYIHERENIETHGVK